MIFFVLQEIWERKVFEYCEVLLWFFNDREDPIVTVFGNCSGGYTTDYLLMGFIWENEMILVVAARLIYIIYEYCNDFFFLIIFQMGYQMNSSKG